MSSFPGKDKDVDMEIYDVKKIKLEHHPVFTIGKFEVPDKADFGLEDNTCLPDIVKDDPGFTLLKFDPWYQNHGGKPKYDYKKPYNPPTNGKKQGGKKRDEILPRNYTVEFVA
jgi:hypothetical protein